MQRRHVCRIPSKQLVPEALAEEAVIPVPLASIIQWDEEEIRVFELFQAVGRVLGASHCVARGSRHPVEDRGLEHPFTRGVAKTLDHHLRQVMDDMTAGSLKLADERLSVLDVAHGEVR